MKPIDAPIRTRMFHDAHLMMILFVFFIAVAFSFRWHTVVSWAFVFCSIGLLQKRFLSFAIKTLALAFVLSSSVWLLNVFFHDKQLNEHEVLLRANQTALKIWSLTWVSLLSSKMLNIRDVVTFALQRQWLSSQIAYALLVGIGSVSLLRGEAKRINLNAKLRGIKGMQRLSQWLPILIFSLRHAQRGAMSLRARGLSIHKSFYYNYQATHTQKVNTVIICLVFILVTLFNEYLP